jgi:hypothetical protein
MDVGYQDALEAYAQLPEELQSPYFHPRYVLNDANRDRLLKPIFLFTVQTESFITMLFTWEQRQSPA